jgi:hypothetical protein
LPTPFIAKTRDGASSSAVVSSTSGCSHISNHFPRALWTAVAKHPPSSSHASSPSPYPSYESTSVHRMQILLAAFAAPGSSFLD